jgi:hypothetical protein
MLYTAGGSAFHTPGARSLTHGDKGQVVRRTPSTTRRGTV